MATKEFPTRDVLSTVTGVLMGDIGGVYEVLNWMTDESLYTHQLPRVSREAQPVILKAHPQLQSAIEESEQVNTDNVLVWREAWENRFGPTIAVPKLGADEHEQIDPMSELAEMVHPDRIITIKTQSK